MTFAPGSDLILSPAPLQVQEKYIAPTGFEPAKGINSRKTIGHYANSLNRFHLGAKHWMGLGVFSLIVVNGKAGLGSAESTAPSTIGGFDFTRVIGSNGRAIRSALPGFWGGSAFETPTKVDVAALLSPPGVVFK